MGSYSEFGFDCEVIFAPFARFKVTNWYHADIVCLGQANIQEHTFKIRTDAARYGDGPYAGKNHYQELLPAMVENNTSIIIEMEELDRQKDLSITQ